ncbi:MAG: DNA polymerase III subunit gamma/tau [Acidimicrobiia bacterium]
MPYQSLYRKYRPQRFDELVGQEHVTTALRNAVRDERVGHAYLFSGPRGTGKTTTARILAKALNCMNIGPDGEPCDACDNCRAIATGTFLDLFELDAASNRGIDNIRDVIESSTLGMGGGAKTKVYVLDEVHMLTDPAANALLKTLEETPSHVVFVLATTNPEKVLPTIRSRTQHFEFTLLSIEQLVTRLGDLCAREGVEADAEALAVIAAAGAGSARDAESLLDQALAHETGPLEAAAVAALFGGAPFPLRVRILESIAGEDSPGALVALGELLEAGHDPRRAAEDLLGTARDGFLLTAGAGRVRVDASEEEKERLRQLGLALGNAALVRAIETLGQAVTDMRGTEAADPRLVLEVALVRLSRRDAGPPLQTVVERIERLERALASGATPASPASAAPASEAPPPPDPRAPGRTIGAVRAEAANAPAVDEPTPVEAASPEQVVEASPAAPPPDDSAARLELDDVIIAWGSILPELPVATRSAVQNAQPLRVDGDIVVFGVPPGVIEAAKPRFKKEADTIRAALAHHLGRTVRFNLEPAEEFSLGGGQPAPVPTRDAPSASGPSGADEPPEMVEMADIDLSQNTDAPLGPPASVSLLQQQLGATVVEELPRDAGS